MPGSDLAAGVPVSTRDIQNNVIRTPRRVDDFSIGDLVDRLPELPGRVVLHAASGGFNTVVEFSARCCLRWFDKFAMPLDHVVPVSASELEGLTANGTPLADQTLQQEIEQDRGFDFFLGIRWKPASLEFADPKRICVRYTGTVALLKRERPRRPEHGRPDLAGIFDGPRSLERLTPDASGSERGELSGLLPGGVSIDQLITIKTWGKVIDDLRPQRILGAIAGTVCCEYRIETDKPRVRALVRADFGSAEVELDPLDGDLKILVEQLIVGPANEPALSIFSFAQIDPLIAPALSLVGYDNASSVPEMPDFEAFAFHVQRGSRHALAVGFDCAPGCRGVIEHVEHFIGDCDYGIITDERVIEALFLHKWNRGGFLRQMSFRNPVTVKMSDGSEQTAQLGGIMRMNTLDAVRLETEANSGFDYVRVGGSATLTPSYLRLADGRTLSPSDVDLGGPQDMPWSINTDIRLTPAYVSDPQMRAFQVRANLDAYRFAGKPFRGLIDSLVEPYYARTDGISRRIFYLANLPIAFG